MRRITFGFLGTLGILLGIALILPFFLNINDYKPQIIAKARETLGRDVHIEGKLSLSLLPTPKLSIDKVGISNLVGGSPYDLVRIKNLSVSVDLFPLLKKQIKINAIELDQPDVFLEKLADGRMNWVLTPATSSVPDAALSPSSSSPHFDVALDKILIHNGRVVYHEKDKDIEIREINVSSKLDSLQGPYVVSGTLKTLGQHIKLDANLGALAESQDIALKVQVDDAISTLEGKVSLLPLAFKGHLKASVDPKMFTPVNSKGKASPLSGPLRVDAAVIANATTVSLNQAKFEIGSARPTGDLKVLMKEDLRVEGNLKNLPGQGQCVFSLSPSPQGIAGSLNATVTQAKELLNWLDIDTKTMPPEILGTLKLSTAYTLGDAIYLKNLNLIIRDAKLQGDISWTSQKGSPLLVVDLESPKVETIFKLLGVKNPKPLGIGKFKSNIQWTATSLHLANLKGQLGKNLSFAGDVTVDQANAKPKVKAILSLNAINIDTLLASRQARHSLDAEGKIFLISAKHRPASPHWSHDPLDFSFLNKLDGQLDISASQLRYKDIVISHPKLISILHNGRLDMNALTGSIFEGSFVGNGSVTADNTVRFHMALKEANLKNLPAQGTNLKIVGGKLFFSSDLSTHGGSLYAMVQNLAGPVTITAKEGVINGFDLRTISQQLGNLQNPRSLLGLLNTSMGKGQTPFSSFKGDMIFKDGVGAIQSMQLIAQGGQGEASGQIDLPRYLLNIQAEFRLTDHPKLPPFRMHLRGPIDNPSRELDTGALQKYMMENVFKGVIDKLGKGKLKAGDILGSFLGGGKDGDKAPANEEPSNKGSRDKSEQIVKDIFKGIF